MHLDKYKNDLHAKKKKFLAKLSALVTQFGII